MLNKILALGIFAVICPLAHPGHTEAQAERNIGYNDPENLVRQLSSESDTVRLAAKAGLIELGPRAVGPLISLLEDLKNNSGPRFALDKEKEGAEVWEYYWNLPQEQRRGKALSRLRSLEVGGRLRNDVYELLGRLGAKDAVPLLVQIMEDQEIYDMIPGMTPVMRAIAEIGPAAVPRLIESIAKVEVTAASLHSGESAESRHWSYIRKQENAVLVLKAIGDPSALPALERLITTSNNVFLIEETLRAIQKLKEKAK